MLLIPPPSAPDPSPLWVIHVPKTAGTSLRYLFQHTPRQLRSPGPPPSGWTAPDVALRSGWHPGSPEPYPSHLPADDALALLDRLSLPRPGRLAITVREPLDRLFSVYRYGRLTASDGRTRPTALLPAAAPYTYADFLRALLDSPPPPDAPPHDRAARPASTLLPSSSPPLPLHVLRYEDGIPAALADPFFDPHPFPALLADPSLPLPRAEPGGPSPDPPSAPPPSPELLRAVRERYRADYELFGYALPA
jgi:hypothetical protein